MPKGIVQKTMCNLEGHGFLPVTISYLDSDPYAMTMLFADESFWIFGRDLLVEALETGSSGTGDVQFRTDGTRVEMKLYAPDFSATVYFSQVSLAGFAEQMLSYVPLGEETSFLDVDSTIKQIFKKTKN